MSKINPNIRLSTGWEDSPFSLHCTVLSNIRAVFLETSFLNKARKEKGNVRCMTCAMVRWAPVIRFSTDGKNAVNHNSFQLTELVSEGSLTPLAIINDCHNVGGQSV